MAVKIVTKFTPKDIHQMVADRVNRINSVVLNRLKFVGEKFVKNAREFGGYGDRTGNLRNSIGYIILHNGVMINENFKRSAVVTRTTKKGKTVTGKGGSDGMQKAKTLIAEIQKEFPKGFVLIVVAGMDYAAAVEAKGYDVITNSSIEAIKDLKQAVKEIKAKIDKIK